MAAAVESAVPSIILAALFADEIIRSTSLSIIPKISDLEKQVIGRAQRMGRMVPLTINYLCFENEYPASIKLTDAAIETSSTEEAAQHISGQIAAHHVNETVVNSVMV